MEFWISEIRDNNPFDIAQMNLKRLLCGDDDVARNQLVDCSRASKLSIDAPLKSDKSSSVQVSDQSTGLPLARSLNWVAHVISELEAAGGSVRSASTRRSSFSLSVITIIIIAVV